MAEYREHMLPNTQCQRVITNGGDQPNDIPKTATVWWYFRAATAEGAAQLFERAKKVAEGAGLMTQTACEVEVLSAVWPVRCNQMLAELVEQEAERVGTPEWTVEEHELASALQRKVGLKPVGLSRTIAKSSGPSKQKSSANDSGDVSWTVPMVKLCFPSNVPNIDYNHWAAGVALATSIAHKEVLAGARVLAGSVLECFSNQKFVNSARDQFKAEVGEVVYESLLPPEQKPLVSLNRATMERFRPLMSQHYVAKRPEFLE